MACKAHNPPGPGCYHARPSVSIVQSSAKIRKKPPSPRVSTALHLILFWLLHESQLRNDFSRSASQNRRLLTHALETRIGGLSAHEADVNLLYHRGRLPERP